MALSQSTIDAIGAAVAAAFAAQAPVVQAPAQPRAFADTDFGRDQLAKQAAKLECELGHGKSCNRRFSANSKGRETHVARIVSRA